MLPKSLTASLPLSERLALALLPTPKQEDADNTPSECVYDEFTELVARMWPELTLTLTQTLTLTLTPTPSRTLAQAPEVLLASFATSALLLDDAEGGGAAGGPADFSLASVTERADLYAFAITCYEVARVRGRVSG